jgi:hypothetical protein
MVRHIVHSAHASCNIRYNSVGSHASTASFEGARAWRDVFVHKQEKHHACAEGARFFFA